MRDDLRAAPAGTPFRVVLISPYDLGRQPFALAQASAWLSDDDFEVSCIDLSLQKLDRQLLEDARLVGISVGMHTATRIAVHSIERIRAAAPSARICVFGLYAPMNESLFRRLGVHLVLGGESEAALLAECRRLRDDPFAAGQREEVVSLDKLAFRVPERRALPALDRYAALLMPDGSRRAVAFTEASRGCKHRCRHCPVVPVYRGAFRVVPLEVVIADIRQQVALGAAHVSFGDPDFLNGPAHALRIVRALAAEFPAVTFDITAKVEHLLESADLLPELRRCGCLFVTAAVESVEDEVLLMLDKHHRGDDFERVASLVRAAGIALAPTFVAFTPWTTLAGYVALLERVVALRLVEAVPPVQLTLRLLIPQGSVLLEVAELRERLGAFDEMSLGYPWTHADARVERLQRQVQAAAEHGERDAMPRREIFETIWRIAHRALARAAPPLAQPLGEPIPRLSEPWYCCAEPTREQLQCF